MPSTSRFLLLYFALSSIQVTASPAGHVAAHHVRQSAEPRGAADTLLAYMPVFSNEKYPPYPTLKNDDGSYIPIANVRGTRIFGGAGCKPDEWQAIKESWHDFHNIVSVDGIKSNIDWTSTAAKEFWGPPTAIPDYTKKFIQGIYASAEQMWSYNWAWEPPWLSWRRLYINVTCSGGDGGGDPQNICGDKKPDDNDGRCPPKKGGKQPGRPLKPGREKLEAYTTSEPPGERYTKITLCNGFFDLPTLGEAVDRAKSKPADFQDNLENWNNRARVWTHEVTHMNYFMNTPPSGKGPWVRDLTINLKGQGDELTYGPYYAKVLRNWNKNAGYYTQMNADTYAWYALGVYAQSLIGRFPPLPNAGSKSPTRAPRDENNESLNSMPGSTEEPNSPDADLAKVPELEWESQRSPEFKIPGCADSFDQPGVAAIQTPSATPPTAPQPTATPPTAPPQPSSDMRPELTGTDGPQWLCGRPSRC